MQLSRQSVDFISTVVRLLDSRFGIGPWRVGIDPLFSLIPGIGGFIPTIFTAFLVITAIRVQAPLRIILLMTGYMAIDLLVSLVPVAGLPLDALFHANAKSWMLLKPFIMLTDAQKKAARLSEDPVIIEGEIVERSE